MFTHIYTTHSNLEKTLEETINRFSHDELYINELRSCEPRPVYLSTLLGKPKDAISFISALHKARSRKIVIVLIDDLDIQNLVPLFLDAHPTPTKREEIIEQLLVMRPRSIREILESLDDVTLVQLEQKTALDFYLDFRACILANTTKMYDI